MPDFSTYTQDDIILLEAIRRNDRKAYNILFNKYYPSLCAYCYRFVAAHEVEDIVQDVMIWVWENRNEDIIKTALKPYLYRMVYNRALNHLKQNDVKFRVEQFFQERIEKNNDTFDPVSLNEMMKLTDDAIEKLPDTYREAFIMNRLKGMSYKEIAEQLQVSSKTVDYRIQQSLKLLRVWLKDYLIILSPLLFHQ